MHVSLIIQARLGSTRLPKKLLKKINNYSIIEWVIIRLKKSKLANSIVLATTINKEDDFLVKIAIKYGINYFRGDENNVLDRFSKAAESINADVVVRVCADNPFVDFELVDQLIAFYLQNEYDYAFNHQARLNNNIADGFGVEILGFSLLNSLNEVIKNFEEREHLTLHIWNNLKYFKIGAPPIPEGLTYPDLTFDIDTLEDLEKLKRLVNNCSLNIHSSARDFIKCAVINERN